VRGPHSVFPTLNDPELFLTAYQGDLGMDSGAPQNVYQLDDKHLKQFKGADGDPIRIGLHPGETYTLPDGAGTVRFDTVKTWASFSISHQSGNMAALIAGVGAILGLAGSLFIQRRRIWVRAVPAEDGAGTVVEMGGLGRSESARIADEVGEVALTLLPDAPPSAPPDGDGDGTPAPEAEDDDEGARA
jgi:cytochrome c biogenesis protein